MNLIEKSATLNFKEDVIDNNPLNNLFWTLAHYMNEGTDGKKKNIEEDYVKYGIHTHQNLVDMYTMSREDYDRAVEKANAVSSIPTSNERLSSPVSHCEQQNKISEKEMNKLASYGFEI